MATIQDRIIRAAKLDARLYEEVEAVVLVLAAQRFGLAQTEAI